MTQFLFLVSKTWMPSAAGLLGITTSVGVRKLGFNNPGHAAILADMENREFRRFFRGAGGRYHCQACEGETAYFDNYVARILGRAPNSREARAVIRRPMSLHGYNCEYWSG